MQLIPTFTDVVKVYNGHFFNVDRHALRISDTIHHFFGKQVTIDFNDNQLPDPFKTGLVKYRIVYSDSISSIEFFHYSFRRINTIRVIEDDSIQYEFKYLDRSCFTNLQLNGGMGEEILIVKNGLVTDTSYSNVVFEDFSGCFYTPSSTLLPGTKRQQLIEQGSIKERLIRKSDIWAYRKVYLVNAMIDLEDDISVECSKIYAHTLF